MNKLTHKQANAVYDILVQECGASETERSNFLIAQSQDEISEWRFCGKLGFGGKFWRNPDMYVNCYGEDMNSERMEIIFKANERLKVL